jgi:hypothetical protein
MQPMRSQTNPSGVEPHASELEPSRPAPAEYPPGEEPFTETWPARGTVFFWSHTWRTAPTLTDAEAREVGYAHRDGDGRWVGLDRLTPSERAARDRRSQRALQALEHPTRVTNADAMSDALKDAFGDRPTVGAIRRGEQVSPIGDTFDWGEVRRHSQQRPVKRRRFSVVSADALTGRTGNRKRRSPTGRATSNTKNRDRAYGIAVLDAECQRVAGTPTGNRNNTLASASFKVGRGAVGPGYLEHDEAFSNLLGAALDCGLSEREARPVIRSGLRAGARKPREVA